MEYPSAQRVIPLLAAFVIMAGLAVATGRKQSRVLSKERSHVTKRSVRQLFACLPKDVTADEVVSYGLRAKQKVTVENKLTELKARCRNGKLVDAKGREIRFFRLSCWGNPPPDYLEIQQRENKELAELKKRYTVIVFSCNPMIQ